MATGRNAGKREQRSPTGFLYFASMSLSLAIDGELVGPCPAIGWCRIGSRFSFRELRPERD
jgi:hypothetical protein